jgi:hypothetical protein
MQKTADDPFIVLTTEANARLVFDRAQVINGVRHH